MSRGGLECDAAASHWSFKETADNTGQLKWKVEEGWSLPGFDAVTADRSIANGNRTYEFVGFAATKWGAVRRIQGEYELEAGERPTKLFSQQNPANNKIFHVSDGTTIQPLRDSSMLKCQLIAP